MVAYILESGTGEDGDEIQLIGIYTTESKAIAAKKKYDAVHPNFNANDPYQYELDKEPE